MRAGYVEPVCFCVGGIFMPEDFLTSKHARRLSVIFRRIDKPPADTESALRIASCKRAFPDCLLDVTPAQQRVIKDNIARIRIHLARVLEVLGIGHPEAFIPMCRSLHIGLTFTKIAAKELHPRLHGRLWADFACGSNGSHSNCLGVGGLEGGTDHCVISELPGQSEPAVERESLAKTERNATT
jgi:hypothetical protein